MKKLFSCVLTMQRYVGISAPANLFSESTEIFSEKGILEEANRALQSGRLSPKELIEGMAQAVHDFVGDTQQSDDLTMLAIFIADTDNIHNL